MEKREEKTKEIWKIAIVVFFIFVLSYLLYTTFHDPRWIFSENSTFLILMIVSFIIIVYILKKKNKQKIKGEENK